jgi:hypothetical protein
MTLEETNKLEEAVVYALNLDGWELSHTGDGFERYDAEGLTPKGKKCVIEMKFRNEYYDIKIIEKKKYDALMSLPEDVVKLYFVSDPKGNYIYWLNELDELEEGTLYLPLFTHWGTGKKKTTPVYWLPENLASRVDQVDNKFG